MAPRFDALADRLYRTTDLINYNTAYSVLFWLYLTTDTNNFVYIWTNNADPDIYHDSVRLDADGVTIRATQYTGAFQQGNGTVLTVNQWYHCALVRVNATSLILYLDGVNVSSTSNSVSGRAANTRMEFGAFNPSNDYRLDGRIHAPRIYSAALSVDEIADERFYARPRRYTNLYGNWPTFPGATERITDWAGNGRNWIEGGTLTDEDGPPLVWDAPVLTFPYVEAAEFPPVPGQIHKTRSWAGLRM